MSSWKCQHATESWESGHRQRCVILSYNSILQLLEKSLKLCAGGIFRHIWELKRFTKIDITFSYGIRITKFLARWKACCEGYVMRWSRLSLVFLLFLHLVIFKKVWFMLLGFSCDGTCLSWIEFIFDLSMWASILVYLFEVIVNVMEAMVMVILEYSLMWYSYRSWWLSWILLA